MFQKISMTDAMAISDCINDFLTASGYDQKHMLIAQINSTPHLGMVVDIAILDDAKVPSTEEHEIIFKGIQNKLKEAFPDATTYQPEFLRTIDDRIPTRGSPEFIKLNADALKRYKTEVKQQGISW